MWTSCLDSRVNVDLLSGSRVNVDLLSGSRVNVDLLSGLQGESSPSLPASGVSSYTRRHAVVGFI